MNKKSIVMLAFLIFLILVISSSCVTIRPYQRIYLDDSEMKFGAGQSEKFELKAWSYREGSVNIAKSKSSGGCGCN